MNQKDETLIEDMKALISDVMARSMYAKTEMCKDEAMTDNPPMLFVGYESDETNPEHDACMEAKDELGLAKPYQMLMVPLIHKADPFEAYQDVIKQLPIEKFDFIVLVLEGYLRENTELATLLESRSLEKDYKENPFTDVREGLIVTAVDWSNTTLLSMTNTYRYDDNGLPMYDENDCKEMDINPNDEERNLGRFGEALVQTVQYMHLAVKSLAYRNLLSNMPKNGEE